MTDRREMLFAAEVSVRYHRRRATFLERASAAMSVIILVAGAGAFTSLVGEATTLAKVATLITAAMGLIQVIFQVDRAAADHRQWLRRWLEMMQDIKATPDASPDDVAKWEAGRLSLEAECVGELRALQVDCFNRAAIAWRSPEKPTPMRWYHRWLIQVVSFEAAFADPVPVAD